MSGALKNWFDFLYGELAGKFAGVVATTGGGTGDMSITAVKTCFQWCHGFVLPFHAAAPTAAFDGLELVDPRVVDRIQRVGHDVARYAPLLRAAFEQARALEGPEGGVAGLH
jgi:FMN reductase